MSKVIARALPNQKKWLEYDRKDLRHLDKEDLLTPQEILRASESVEEALEVITKTLMGSSELVELGSPIGSITINKSMLSHIVEKRQDARERFVNLVVQTICNPYEVYESQYDDGSSRIMFIGAFEGKRQILVVAKKMEDDSKWLWNFMHCDAKSLNKHRHGEMLYAKPIHKEAH